MSSSTDYLSFLEKSTDENDKTMVIRQVTQDVVTFSVPFTRGGIVPIGGRTTAIRIPRSTRPTVTDTSIQPSPQITGDSSNADVLVYVSTPPTPATIQALAALGDVKWLVTPDGEHTIHIEAFTKAYPSAQAIGVARCAEKKPDIKWAGLFGGGHAGEDKKYGFEPEVSLHQVSAHVNHELTAIHHPSGTLVEADLLFNLPPTEQYSRAGGLPTLFKWLGAGKGMSPGGAVHDLAAGAIIKDKELFKKEVQPILAAKWDRIIPCHGDVIEDRGRVEWEKVWGRFE